MLVIVQSGQQMCSRNKKFVMCHQPFHFPNSRARQCTKLKPRTTSLKNPFKFPFRLRCLYLVYEAFSKNRLQIRFFFLQDDCFRPSSPKIDSGIHLGNVFAKSFNLNAYFWLIHFENAFNCAFVHQVILSC